MKAPVLSTAMETDMCMETFPVTNVPVYLNAFPARPVLCTLESYTGNTSVMTLGLTEQECYHLKKNLIYQNEANLFMPMKVDTDNLPVQTYSLAVRTILDKAFQYLTTLVINGFTMHLIAQMFFQSILQCMQYASYHFLSEVTNGYFET